MTLLTPMILARISLAGKALELLGGCYLAYDLLDGRNGPLRSIARATGYVPLFLLGYAVVLGWPFALVASAGMGALLAIEFHFAVLKTKAPRWIEPALGFCRGLVLGTAAMTILGAEYGAILGVIAGIGLVVGNAIGLAPRDDYDPKARPGLRPHNVMASLFRGVVFALSAVIAGEILRVPDALIWTLRMGAAAGGVSLLVGVFSPVIERWIGHAPQRVLGIIGLILLFVGTAIDAAPDIVEALGLHL